MPINLAELPYRCTERQSDVLEEEKIEYLRKYGCVLTALYMAFSPEEFSNLNSDQIKSWLVEAYDAVVSKTQELEELGVEGDPKWGVCLKPVEVFIKNIRFDQDLEIGQEMRRYHFEVKDMTGAELFDEASGRKDIKHLVIGWLGQPKGDIIDFHPPKSPYVYQLAEDSEQMIQWYRNGINHCVFLNRNSENELVSGSDWIEINSGIQYPVLSLDKNLIYPVLVFESKKSDRLS